MSEWRTDYHKIEPDREIILLGSDFMGEYIIDGMMKSYKKVQKNGKKTRFCTRCKTTGEWESNHSEWRNREGWKYK